MFWRWGLVSEWVWSRSILSKYVWNCYQISIVKIRQHFTLFSWRKSSNASPQMRHSAQNALLTKLLMWEYSNGDAPFSWRKFSMVLHLVRYGVLAGFCIYVYGTYKHACIVTSRSPSKHQACWCMSHTRGNQHHLVTWIKTITPRWSCTQYSMNIHLWQSLWAHTHITRPRALISREGHSCSHKRPSCKV